MSKNGPKTKVPQHRELQVWKMVGRARLRALGVVQVVIFRIMTSLQVIPVGVRKKLILDHSLVFLHILVVKLAQGLARDVPILVILPAMLARVRLALPWGRHRIASVA